MTIGKLAVELPDAFALPATVSPVPSAVVVPMPTCPVLLILNSVVVAVGVEEAIRKAYWLVSPELRLIASLPHGVVVPMPMFPPNGFNNKGRAAPLLVVYLL